MKFYDREEEIGILGRNKEQSEKEGMFTVITGRRRIGKTALIKESEKGNRFLYFFAERGSETLLCEQLAADAKACLGLNLFNTGRFRDLFEQLMQYGTNNNFTFVIDEFQELAKADPSIMSGIQKHWDWYKSGAKVNLIVCGSVHSMMVKIFEHCKEPLFGRASSKFKVRPFTPSVIKTILRDHNPNYAPDDLLFLYMVTGGVAKYIEILMDRKAWTFEKMLDAVCSHDSLFLTDGKDLLISEFGKEYGTYFSILRLISVGKNTLGEMNSILGRECAPYLETLDRDYDIVKRDRPVFSKDNSKDVRWRITDNYLRFYFRYVNGNRLLTEMGQYGLLKEAVRKDYESYSGRVLENYFKEKIAEEERVTEIGSHWNRKGGNEIDIIALNDLDTKAAVIEVKRNPEKADVRKLKEKAATIHGLKEYETEYRTLSLNDM